MDTLKLVWLTICQLVRQVWSIPQSVADAVRKRQRKTVLDEVAAERLDRLRNPSKYAGK